MLGAHLSSTWHRLLYYTPSATVVRLLTTNFLIAYITSWVLYLSGASEDPRMLLPAWVSIATVCSAKEGWRECLADPNSDDHYALSPDPPQYQSEERDPSIVWYLCCCLLYQSLFSASTTTSHKRERSGCASVLDTTTWLAVLTWVHKPFSIKFYVK